MPRPPLLRDAKRTPLPHGVAKTGFAGLAVLEPYPPPNPLTDLRERLGFDYVRAADITGMHPGFFPVLEAESAIMSSREVIALFPIYHAIAEAARGKRKIRPTTGRRTWEWLTHTTDAIDARISVGAPKGVEYANIFQEWLGAEAGDRHSPNQDRQT